MGAIVSFRIVFLSHLKRIQQPFMKFDTKLPPPFKLIDYFD